MKGGGTSGVRTRRSSSVVQRPLVRVRRTQVDGTRMVRIGVYESKEEQLVSLQHAKAFGLTMVPRMCERIGGYVASPY